MESENELKHELDNPKDILVVLLHIGSRDDARESLDADHLEKGEHFQRLNGDDFIRENSNCVNKKGSRVDVVACDFSEFEFLVSLSVEVGSSEVKHDIDDKD